MIMKHFLIIITILSACICQAQTLPDALFAHIESSGTYTMLADKGNHLGLGEKVAISTDFYMARPAREVLQGVLEVPHPEAD